jgi:hypothetical protein
VTIIELLMAVLIGVVIITGAGSLHLQMTRAWMASNDQIAMQRQGSLVLQEISRIVIASNGILGGTCGPAGNRASLPVRVPVSALPETATSQANFCFYWPSSPGSFVECRFASDVNTTCTTPGRNLLLGGPTSQTIQATAVTFTVVNSSTVDVAVTLQAFDGNTVRAGPLSFATRVSVRN